MSSFSGNPAFFIVMGGETKKAKKKQPALKRPFSLNGLISFCCQNCSEKAITIDRFCIAI